MTSLRSGVVPMSPDDSTESGSGLTVSMTLLGVVTANWPPASEATVRVANTGDVTVRPRLSAVDDWSPAGSVPAQPPEVELRQGRHRDVRVRTRRPLVRPISRGRRGAVTVYAELDGMPIAGPVYEVPPLVGWRTVMVGLVVLLVGLGALVVRPAGRSSGPGPDAGPAVVGESSATPAGPGTRPDAADRLPADVLFDVPVEDGANTHTPVLVGRDGSTASLEPGGRVALAVKVPSGWVVKRQVVDSAVRSRVLYVRGGEVLDLTPGVPNPSFWVDETGTRVAVDGRDGKAGAISVVALPGGAAEATIELPAHVRVVGWLGPAVLMSTLDDSGAEHYSRWPVTGPYEQTPTAFAGRFLGAVGDGAVAIHQRDGELDCILQVVDLFQPARHALRCGFGVPVDSELLHGRWSAVSPGGWFVAVPGRNRSAYFAPMPAMLGGLVGFEPAAGLPGPVIDLTWRDGTTAALLVSGDDTQVWSCTADRGVACRATPVEGPPGLSPVQLVARVPAGG